MDKLEMVRAKILSQDQLGKALAVWRFKGRAVVFTNGCFDILHLGHVEYLARARDLGHVLVVGLNSDDSVRRLKGPDRPVNGVEARAALLAALSFVDAVCVFEEDTPFELIRIVQPDILVKGKDYDNREIVGRELVESRGGRVVTIDLTDGFSTTGLISKLSGGRPE